MELTTWGQKDASDQNECEKFVRRVIENNLCIDLFKCIHRGSVDEHFKKEAALRNFLRAGASRVVQALQWSCLNLETPSGDFAVWNPIIKEAIDKQQENNLKNLPASTHWTCPHRGLKDTRRKQLCASFFLARLGFA
jgi:hypothetical protein